MRAWLVSALLLIAVCLPTEAVAHDDPIVTVRVMCNGFNALDMDVVLGEISDSATVSVDRPVHGPDQLQQWVQEQMDDDLRIEILDIGIPQKLTDGYTLTWTARFSRQDWRNEGIPSREVSNLVTIHNGRITEWTAKLGVGTADAGASLAVGDNPVVGQPQAVPDRMPELFGIPVSLVLAAILAIVGGVVIMRAPKR